GRTTAPRALGATGSTRPASGPFGPAAEKRLPSGRTPGVENPRKVRTTMTDIFYSLESEVRSYSRSWPVEFVQASGATQKDSNGTEYLDFFSGAGALTCGPNHPAVMAPLVVYLQPGAVLHGRDMMTPAKREFLQTCKGVILAPRELPYKVMFPGSTGTNTVEAALK